MSRTAVVILNWNGIDYLRRFLPKLVEHTSIPGVELIVADNGSEDQSVEFIRTDFPAIRIIELKENFGFAGGYNKALKQVEADYFMILNSDIEVTENWIEPLIKQLDREPDLAACSPLVLDYNKRDSYEYAGAAGGYIDRYGYTFCRGRVFDSVEPIHEGYNTPADVFWTTGACMLARADLFNKAGGFDERFFAHMEEVDLCWRWKNMGYRLTVIPAAKVFHVGGGTLPKSNPYKTYLNFRNNLFMLYKNLPANKLSRVLLIRLLMDSMSAFRFLIRFSFKDIAAIWRAHQHFFGRRKEYREFRNLQSKMNVKTEHEEQYGYSIVLDYFLMGHKKFTQLRGEFSKKFISLEKTI